MSDSSCSTSSNNPPQSQNVGLHQSVAILDYNNEFANIIINQNINYKKSGKGKSFTGHITTNSNGTGRTACFFRKLLKQLQLVSN
ncbi:MAG: hypothetical protein E6K97_01885 [Thaumarchaeota archaeon]|nr:MAG: hypothetical protein E6K97_01885 [Nitrososphaerota archaeon]